MPTVYAYKIPYAIRSSLDRYALTHVETGGFLRAVLENDLEGALARADLESFQSLKDIVLYVHNELPGNCYGSPERVTWWLADRG